MDSSQKGLEEWSGTEGCLGTSLVCHDSKDATAIWLPRWLSGKESACQCSGCKRCRFYPWVRKIPWRKKQQPTSVFLLGKSHGQRSLVGCSPWGREESDTTERLHFHFSLSCIGEGNGNPLQCSCLENPRDGGACWATVYGVAQSRTRLKRLSSSSRSRSSSRVHHKKCQVGCSTIWNQDCQEKYQ